LIPDKGRTFSLLHSFQTSFGAHLTSCVVVTSGSFCRGKAAEDVKLTEANLCIYDNDTVIISDCVALNGWMISEQQSGRDMKGRDHHLI
jgi:hypothetical protein